MCIEENGTECDLKLISVDSGQLGLFGSMKDNYSYNNDKETLVRFLGAQQ